MEFSYLIADGNIVQSSGMINISPDLAALEQLMNPTGALSVGSEMTGELDLTINYTTDILSINQPLEIQIPVVTPENSFDYFEFVSELAALTEQAPIVTTPSVPEPAVTTPVATTTYTVKAGDTLGTIAQQFYGDSKQYTKIYEANKGTIASTNLIYVGQVLVIPQ
jgi:nucleoid-associated protein YgaU